ncbi:unnamed protein product [Symbiodinium natans]|uniref:Uncharacterized protein n=1 Tax=Symbiodinium natans TaxID=878477 RepID=A0A812I852_9DINO|nr:unnamed protein product [Symbiodinium natans]
MRAAHIWAAWAFGCTVSWFLLYPPPAPSKSSPPSSLVRPGLPLCAKGVRQNIKAEKNCGLPFPKHTEPLQMASSAEHLYACSGLKFAGPISDRPAKKQRRRCAGVAFQTIGQLGMVHEHNMYNMSNVEDLSRACIKTWDPAKIRASEACAQMSACSSAWNVLNTYAWGRPVPQLEAVVRWQHELFLHYVASAMAEQQLVEAPACLKYPLPRRLCGGMMPYPQSSMLEPLFPDLRNMWYHEHGALIDFTPYLPLPAIPGFASAGRRILIIVGGNEFNRATKYLLDMYSPYFSFDEVMIFDAHFIEVPAVFNTSKTRITFRQRAMNIATRDESDLVYMLPSMVREADFVVLMWDTDLNHIQVTLEWGFLADLLSQPLKLVDELYIELHFAYKSISGYTWEGFVQKVSASSTSSLGGPDSPTSLDRK